MTERQQVTRRLVYRGTVQGVGFRMTARRVAGRFPVTGIVRNLADGTVELVARGSSVEIERFLGALAETMAGYITEAAETEPGPEEIPARFEIRA